MNDYKIRIRVPNWGMLIFVGSILLFLLSVMGYVILSTLINRLEISPDGIEFKMFNWESPTNPHIREEKIGWEEIQGLLYVMKPRVSRVNPTRLESNYILLTKRLNLPIGYFGKGDIFGSRLTPHNVGKIVEMIKKGAGLEGNPSGYRNYSYPGWEIMMVFEKSTSGNPPEETVTFRTFNVFMLAVFGMIVFVVVLLLLRIILPEKIVTSRTFGVLFGYGVSGIIILGFWLLLAWGIFEFLKGK